MNQERDCPECGMVVKDRFALYRHTIDCHRKRYCLFCSHEEGQPSRMCAHVERVHPSVPREMLDRKLWRNEAEAIMEVVTTMTATFPTPEGYSPLTEAEMSVPWEYVPTISASHVSPWQEIDDIYWGSRQSLSSLSQKSSLMLLQSSRALVLMRTLGPGRFPWRSTGAAARHSHLQAQQSRAEKSRRLSCS